MVSLFSDYLQSFIASANASANAFLSDSEVYLPFIFCDKAVASSASLLLLSKAEAISAMMLSKPLLTK